MKPLTTVAALLTTAAITVVSAPAAAGADTGPRRTARPAAVTVCHYKVVKVDRGSHLNIRKGRSLNTRVIGRFHRGARISGSCVKSRGWVLVPAAKGRFGWSSARYLRRI
ncbi:SH3 domain-containing protein [Rhizohabitans arisaemae]|uniref:SH3 domain-containing protein n=1 Tax=Rhizohabitans arisaemae TaxID=2720610 RepID=UPI0024B03D11|nr:SH3 domain-containing protein [Rhizohabitans arisaemae]